MNKRIRKKLLRKEERNRPSPAAGAEASTLPEQIKSLAVECWRIRNLLPEFACSKKQPVLGSVAEKMTALFASLGIEIEDPTGWEYKDGMTMNVALFENAASLPLGVRRITETLSPNLYASGKLVQSARIIVSVGTAGSK
jgi:hypothetical protein